VGLWDVGLQVFVRIIFNWKKNKKSIVKVPIKKNEKNKILFSISLSTSFSTLLSHMCCFVCCWVFLCVCGCFDDDFHWGIWKTHQFDWIMLIDILEFFNSKKRTLQQNGSSYGKNEWNIVSNLIEIKFFIFAFWNEFFVIFIIMNNC